MEDFWDRHYESFAVEQPSSFAFRVAGADLRPSDILVELGCGNGRDARLLAPRVRRYVGIDSSPRAIERAHVLLERHEEAAPSFQLVCGDFTEMDLAQLAKHVPSTGSRLVIYSRFSLHSITARQQARLFAHLEVVGLPSVIVFVEARTIFDELFGVGTEVEKNAYESDHFRRFIDPNEFRDGLPEGYVLQSLEVGRGFASLGGNDPIVMRAAFGRDRKIDAVR